MGLRISALLGRQGQPVARLTRGVWCVVLHRSCNSYTYTTDINGVYGLTICKMSMGWPDEKHNRSPYQSTFLDRYIPSVNGGHRWAGCHFGKFSL
jgi:hypothetical protein